MIYKHYSLNTADEVQTFFVSYLPLVKLCLQNFGVLGNFNFSGDHLGLQVGSAVEFDAVHNLLTKYCETITEGVIHNRRNNTYKLHDFITHDGVELQSIEMFEPKPDVDVSKLKLGFEHIALYSPEYTAVYEHFCTNDLPIAKSVDMHGSKFFKTTFMNLVEIEFRNDYLWQSLKQT
jgi:hypothetical protein